jgi:hypothetical protein
LTVHGNDALADILRKIAYALDLIRNPQDPNDLPKVTGYRLPTCNGLNCPFLNVALHDVDRHIGSNYPLCATAVAHRQRFDRLGNLPFGQPTHLCDYPREFLKVGVEDFGGVFRMSHCGGVNPSLGTRRKRPFYDGSMSAR